MRIVFLSILALYSFSAPAKQNPETFLSGCTVFNLQGEIKSFPGVFCQFLDDGTFISGGNGLRRIGKNHTVMWEQPGIYHHQVNLSPDKKRILALSSEINLRGKLRERDDVMIIHDIETGKVLHRRLARDILTANKITPLHKKYPASAVAENGDLETSHFNTIYEIPDNAQKSKISYLRPGNILINSIVLGIFILTPDLQKTLYHKVISRAQRHQIHDVQVLKSGEFIFFNNQVSDPAEKNNYSAINKFDPVTNKITYEFTPKPKGFFFSSSGGGVQEIDEDQLFFSHYLIGGYLYSRKKNTLILTTPGTYGKLYDLKPTQQIKMVDIRKFRENSK